MPISPITCSRGSAKQWTRATSLKCSPPMQATSSVVLGASRDARLESSPISRWSLHDAWILRLQSRKDVLLAYVMHSISQSSPLLLFPDSCPALGSNMRSEGRRVG